MVQRFWKFIYCRLLGWKSDLQVEIPDKCVVCVAPHTSNWDFIIGKIFYSSLKGKIHFLMKKEWFFFPLGYIFKAMGGVPVDRKNKKTSLTEQMIERFNRSKEYRLAISPEGTRKKNTQWKTGFYYIALGAKVPISLAHIDYEKKEIGLSLNFLPTGNVEDDMEKIKNFYVGFKGKYPENFSL
ncbi:MAG: 1-acyl-sn-glycerol-3-phosphate acyltransferase [Dysgonamonadaceae bacterium]|jgi:1-acyl-sn-glycerol-3-phosphate acyltransferase|nr:1-acyl-sn-glycerol-3-phosphate acyltransferase [Dysgonamonadaceae bacterium]